ncbi:MAG: hypothetical protein BWY71_01349 [Planctomycetes bacterium ADurb.Bin412]|nr:MAG: hypothetical protein BWY71_01349 [Planctomycetes bacterium ADurb.Bin412]
MIYVKIYKTLSCLEYKLRLYIIMLLSAMETDRLGLYITSLLKSLYLE